MQSMNCVQLLYAAYAGSKEEQTAAMEQLETAVRSPNGPAYILAILKTSIVSDSNISMNTSSNSNNIVLASEQRMLGLIFVKNWLRNTLSEELLANADDVLTEMQHVLLGNVMHLPETQRRIVCSCLELLVSSYDWNYLPELMPHLINSTPASEPIEHVIALLEVIYVVAKRFKIARLEKMSMKVPIVSTLLQYLSKYIALGNFRVAHLVFKLLECCLDTIVHEYTASHSSSASSGKTNKNKSILSVQEFLMTNYNVQMAALLDNWFTLMVQFPMNQFANATESKNMKTMESYAKCVKRIALISTTLLQHGINDDRDTQRANSMKSTANHKTRKGKNHKAAAAASQANAMITSTHFHLAQYFFTTFTESYMNLWRSWLIHTANNVHDRSTHRKSEIYALNYFKLCISYPPIYTSLLHPIALQLIEQVFFVYLCYDANDDEVFADEDDLDTFAKYMEDELTSLGELSQRAAAHNVIIALINAENALAAGGGDNNNNNNNNNIAPSQGGMAGASAILPQSEQSTDGGKPIKSKQKSKAKANSNKNALLFNLIRVLSSGLALNDNADNFPRVFGFFNLFMLLRKFLRAVPEIWSSQVSQVLIQFIVPRLQNEQLPLSLRCKALMVCARYARAPIALDADFASFVHLICNYVKHPNVQLRLCAIDVMCMLLQMKRARPFMNAAILVPLMEECIVLLNKVQTTFVPSAIMHLVTYFAPELAAVLDKLTETLVQHFLAMNFSLASQEVTLESEDGHEMNDKALMQFDKDTFNANALLEAIVTVVLSCKENMTMFARMRPSLIHLVKIVLQQEDSYDFIDNVLCILQHIIAYSKEVPAECWELLPMLFTFANDSIGLDYFVTIEAILDNYLSYATVAYFTNQPVMEASYATCEKLLIGGTLTDTVCKVAAAELISSMMHEAKGLQLQAQGIRLPMHQGMTHNNNNNNNVLTCSPEVLNNVHGILESYIPRCVLLMLKALIHPDTEKCTVVLRVQLVTSIMDCCMYNAPVTINTMLANHAFEQFCHGMFSLFSMACNTTVSGVENMDKTLQHVVENAAKEVQRVNNSVGNVISKKKRNKAKEEAVAALSYFNAHRRKCVALGLVALLNYMVQPMQSNTSHIVQQQHQYVVFMQQFLQPALRLIQYCILANEEMYVSESKRLNEILQKFRDGTVRDDDFYGENESSDDSDDDDDDDEDDENEFSDIDDYGEEVMNEAEWDEDAFDEEDDDELDAGLLNNMNELDDDDDEDAYTSPIDSVNEVFVFQQWLSSVVAQMPVEVQGKVREVLCSEGKLQLASQHAAHYAELAQAVVEAERAEFVHRVSQIPQ